MPMPVKSCAADVSTDVCCDTLWLIGERLRTVAFNAVCTCLDPDCRDREFSSYSTEGDIYSILGDSLVITFVRAQIAPQATSRAGMRAPHTTRAHYRMELRENGWPLPVKQDATSQTLIQEDPAMLHVLSKHARGHGEKMWRALVNGAVTSNLAERLFRPSLHPHIMERGVVIGDLTPLPNTGPQVGYRVNITVDTQLR